MNLAYGNGFFKVGAGQAAGAILHAFGYLPIDGTFSRCLPFFGQGIYPAAGDVFEIEIVFPVGGISVSDGGPYFVCDTIRSYVGCNVITDFLSCEFFCRALVEKILVSNGLRIRE